MDKNQHNTTNAKAISSETASVGTLDWLSTLEAELGGIREVLAQLEAGIESQAALIKSKDAAGMGLLFDARQAVVASIEETSERIAPLIERMTAESEQLDSERASRIQEVMAAISGSLEKVLEADRDAESLIAEAMDGIQQEISMTRTVSQANHAYHGGSTTAPEARFSDRKV